MYAQPDYPAALMSLQGMDCDQLKEILNNEDKFDNFMKELPQVKSLVSEKVSVSWAGSVLRVCRTEQADEQ